MTERNIGAGGFEIKFFWIEEKTIRKEKFREEGKPKFFSSLTAFLPNRLGATPNFGIAGSVMEQMHERTHEPSPQNISNGRVTVSDRD